jgi:hypothetical protein
MGDKHVELLKRSFIEDIEKFASGELALGMLNVDTDLAAAEKGFGAARIELFKYRAHSR